VRLITLSDVGAHPADLVGGKAAGLGAMLRLGLRVPDGFVVTTEAWRSAEIPRAQVIEAYERLGGGPVAVRSSATAEDSPDVSFAGQFGTVLDVRGPDALIAAVEQCCSPPIR
jgi:phosphoenolpyruvate synthase/pyruvate phosphate dikinase